MPETPWRKVWRDAVLALPRTLLVATAVAVALGGAGVVLLSWALVRRATHEGYLASDPAVATLRLDRVDGRALELARAHPAVRDAEARLALSISLQVQGTWQPALVFASHDPARRRLGALTTGGGTWPPPPGTLAIERSSVEFSGAALGDSVLVTTPDGTTRAVAVSGFVRDVGLAPGWMEHVVYAWTTVETLAALGLPAVPDELQLAVRDATPTRTGVRQVVAELRSTLEGAGYRVLDADVPEPGEHIHAAQMDSLLVTQGAFGLLALLTGAFLVVNLLTAMLAGQVRLIGIMKTLGASDRQLQAMYLGFAAGLGVLATAVAFPVAWWGGRRYAALRGDMLNFDVAAFAIPAWAMALLLVVGVLLPVAAAWLPVRRGLALTVAESLRDVGLGEAPAVTAAGAGREVHGWSRIWLLSLRNAFRRKGRMRLTMLTLATGGAVFIAAGNLRRAVIGSMDLIYGSQRFDFSVRLGAPVAPDSVASLLAQVGGVDRAELWAGARGTIMVDRFPVEDLPLIGVPDDTRLLVLTPGEAWCTVIGAPTSTRPPCPDALPHLLLARSTRRVVPGVASGDTLTLSMLGRDQPVVVAGFFDGGPTPQAYINAASLERITGESRRRTVVVASGLRGLAARVDLIARVRSALSNAGVPVASSQLLEESRRVTEDHLLMVVQFLGAMGWVMILVGGMGLASTMGLAVLERTREIAVMRAIGASHGALFGLIQGEGAVIAAAGWLLAVPLSLPFSLVLGEAFSRIMFRVPVHLTPYLPAVGLWLGIALAVSLAACLWPAWRAMRQPVAGALLLDA